MSTADTPIPKPDYWEAAVAHLMRRDRILKKIIPQHPDAWLTSRGTPFVTLARAIIGQQVSTKAADAVWDKFIEAAGKRPTPVAVLRVGIDGLRQAGLSQRKAEYVLDLAAHFGERRVHPERWRTWMTKPSFPSWSPSAASDAGRRRCFDFQSAATRYPATG